jgi:hypothetical protein
VKHDVKSRFRTGDRLSESRSSTAAEAGFGAFATFHPKLASLWGANPRAALFINRPLSKEFVLKPTDQKITVGRIVHVYSDLWVGPRPGLVTHAFAFGPSYANVNVFADGTLDEKWLENLRKHPHGNTLASLPILDFEKDGSITEAVLENHGVTYDRGDLTIRALAVWPPR